MIFSAALLLINAPLFPLILLLIWIESGRPAIFRQPRVGREGQIFTAYKFRTMFKDNDDTLHREYVASLIRGDGDVNPGGMFKLTDDPRITAVGKWIRRTSLDELPQFFNVLIGDMSLVGPRPPVPREVARYSLADRRRLAVKPGITCFWQIGGRSEIDFSGQVQLDVDYIETQSFWIDLKILTQTLPAVLSGKGAC